MIAPNTLLSAIQAAGIQFITGVPDSLLKDISACFMEKLSEKEHVIATNEGSAIGMAIGNYLATGNPALVYMQNSGLGNAINPLVSLADPQIFGCPMVLLIGWRGELVDGADQLKDEPQHAKQGQITLDLLETLGIPCQIMDSTSDPIAYMQTAVKKSVARSGPVAIVVRKGSFLSSKFQEKHQGECLLSREEAIWAILEVLPDDVPIISTTGMCSRELFELRQTESAGDHRDLLCVGGMGHAIAIANGIALAKPKLRVVCLDGDGALLMHMGALANAALCPNLLHITLNNGSHDSVGGQPTRAADLNLFAIAAQCGYQEAQKARTRVEIHGSVQALLETNDSCFLEIVCRRGGRSDLGRPTRSPRENMQDVMRFLNCA